MKDGRRRPQEIRQRKPIVDRKICRACGTDHPIEDFFYGGMYRELCANHYREYRKRWNLKHRDKLRAWHHANDIRRAAIQNWRQHERHATIKWEVFTHYGGANPKCACCGEDALEFLCVDHINGGGEQHRKLVGSGVKFYRWIVKNNFPEGFRILCHNCNMALGFYGYCPHYSEERCNTSF